MTLIFDLNNLYYLNNFWPQQPQLPQQFLTTIFDDNFDDRFLENFSDFLKILWPDTWHLRHWLHCWQLRTTILTITLWPLNKEWQGQHSQFLRCFLVHIILTFGIDETSVNTVTSFLLTFTNHLHILVKNVKMIWTRKKKI